MPFFVVLGSCNISFIGIDELISVKGGKPFSNNHITISIRCALNSSQCIFTIENRVRFLGFSVVIFSMV